MKGGGREGTRRERGAVKGGGKGGHEEGRRGGWKRGAGLAPRGMREEE